MAGSLGKTRPGAGYKKPKKKAPPPSRHERAEHAGRVPQPGVPSGPRQTVPQTPAQKKKHKGERTRAKAVKKQRAEARAIAKITGPQARATKKKPGYMPDPYSYKPPDAIRMEVEGKVVEPLKKAGYEKTTGQKAYQRIAEYGPYVLPEVGGLVKGASAALAKTTAKEIAGKAATSGAESSAKSLLKKATGSVGRRATARAKAVKTAPRRAAKRVKETPKRVKTAPRRAKKAVSTKEGRRAVAKSGAKAPVKHPVKVGVPVAGTIPNPEGVTGELPGQPFERAGAFVKGTAAATVQHPGKTLETTGHGVLGALAAPLSVGAAGVESVKQGSTKPLTEEVGNLVYQPKSETGTGREGGIVGMTKSLASGDPKLVEETTLQESGLVPFIPLPAIARRLKRTEAYERARGGVRAKVEGKRAKTRERRIGEQKAAQEAGAYISKRKAKKVRHAVEDSERPGEHYVARRIGKRIEKQRSRTYVAREVARMEQHGMLAGRGASERVAKELRKSKGTNQKEQNYGEALRIVVKHGIPRDEARGLAFVNLIHEGYKRGEHGETPPGVHLDRHSTQFILDHPEIFKDKAFWKGVERFDEMSKPLGTSPRNQFLAQVDNVINPQLKREGKTPILKPEEMIPPAAVKLLPKRERPWSREEALDYVAELRKVKDHSRAEALAKAKVIEGELGDLMKPPKHGGAKGGVSTTRAVTWTPEMEKAFVIAAKREAGRLGLREPAAYVADVVPASLKGGESMPNYGALHPLNKVWPSAGKAARSGNAESSFESTVFHSLEAPHARRATVRGLNNIFDRASRKIGGRRYVNRAQAEKLVNTNQVPPGVIPVRTQFLKSILEGERPVSPREFREALMGEFEHGQKLVSQAKDELAGEMKAAQEMGLGGDKYAWLDSTAMHELLGHMEGPGAVSTGMGHATNFATRAILNSPAFELSQFVQEGVPGAAALGRDIVSVPKAIASLRTIGKLDSPDQAQIRATVGSSVGVLGAPSLRALRSEGYMNPIRAAGSKQAWRHAWELVNGDKLTRFDRARAGRFREVASISRIEGDFRRAERGFQLWRSSANNLFKGLDRAVEDMKGMTREERLLYVTEHPQLADRLTKSMNGMMGNWNSFTVFEKRIAPFTIFYPFQRYSVLWMLYHFPLDHPVVATGLAMLGEVNAQELQKLAARKGAVPGVLDYTKPVVSTGEPGKEMVQPAGQRFFPAVGSVQQAVLEGKSSQALGGLNPLLGIGIEALTGKNAYTGEDLGENGWLYVIRQAANLSPALRFLGIPDIGKPASVAGETFESFDPLRTERSVVNPFIGQSGQKFAEEKQLAGQGFAKKYSKGSEYKSNLPPEVWEAAYNEDWEAAKRLRKMREEAERGSDIVRKYEKPHYGDDGGKLGDRGSKILQYITGQIVLPVEEEKKSGNPYLEALEPSKKGNVYLEALEKKSGGNAYLQALK